jgi:AAA+ ATPase superfamily predicted ATPase
MKIIGQNRELHTFKNIVASSAPEFVALYGRRRVGKTFLVREFQQGILHRTRTGV